MKGFLPVLSALLLVGCASAPEVSGPKLAAFVKTCIDAGLDKVV